MVDIAPAVCSCSRWTAVTCGGHAAHLLSQSRLSGGLHRLSNCSGRGWS